jgi:hypothetical protein
MLSRRRILELPQDARNEILQLQAELFNLQNPDYYAIETRKPRIICLCGSTRFTHDMSIIQWELTKQGHIVLSWCILPDDYFTGEDKTHIGDQEGVKEIVDEVHKRKIDISDEIYVININGYIGESTRSEIKYAETKGIPVKYLYTKTDADSK